MPLLVIGDSHVSVFTGLHGLCARHPARPVCALPGIDVRHLGPFLAHSVASPSHPVREIIRRVLRGARRATPVLLAFGEIDCRAHVVRHAPAGACREAGATLARRYVDAGRAIVGGRPLAFLAVPPPTRIDPGLNPETPVAGAFAQRAAAARGFNEGLHESARRRGASVLDVTAALADARGAPRRGCVHDGVHADPRALPHLLAALRDAGWISKETLTIGTALARVPPPPPPPPPAIIRNDPRLVPALVDRAALLCVALGARRIALFGAGAHTRRIGLRPFRARGLVIEAILDDRPRAATMLGAAVARPVDPSVRPDAVVISSDAHERLLLARARAIFGPRGVPVIPIYDLGAAPSTPSRTIASRSRAKRS